MADADAGRLISHQEVLKQFDVAEPCADRYEPQGVQSEFEPGSRKRVLRNLLGIRLVDQMNHAESAALVLAQKRLVEMFAVDHRFSSADIQRIHHEWLRQIYPWAGEFRRGNLAKGGFQFAAADRIPVLMAQFEQRELAQCTPCSGAKAAVRPIAIIHAELVLIHPFREGNGRCARLLAILMGLQAGLPPLDFRPLEGRGKPAYIAAIHAALNSNYEPMVELFSKVVDRALRRIAGKFV